MHYTFELLQNNMILNDINEDGNYFSAVPNELDKNINYYFDRYKERFAK
jgi:hypothetical protein